MRIIVVLILLVLLSAGLYTAYGVLTFQPEKPAPLVFQEPTTESLIALGVLPKDRKPIVPLSPEQQDRTRKAVAKISEAIDAYKILEARTPLRARETLNILTSAMSSGVLPAYLLAPGADRRYEMLSYDPAATLETTQNQSSVVCGQATSILIGNDADDTLSCADSRAGDRIYIGGPGNDTITDTSARRIVSSGSGDDTITLGPGRSIIVLEESWGQDKVTADCTGADVAPNSAPKDFPVPWVSRYTNFIVLSPRISPESVRWAGNVLTNTVTGDTLTVNANCFTLAAPR